MKATIEQLKDLLDERIVVLDGSYGVLIQKTVKGEEAYRGEQFADHPRDVAGDPDLLNLTQPDVVRDRQHLLLFDFSLAREAADELERPAWVAGSIGPLNVSLSLSPKVDDPSFRSAGFDQVREAYAEQIRGLAEGRVDILMIETIFDTLNAKAAVVAAKDVTPDLPLWISFTAIDKSEAFWTSIEHADPLIVGVNCSLGATEMRPFVEDLARVATTYVACHPNAGLPNAMGEHDEQPGDTSRILGEFARDGLVNIVGGCCGTTPEHVKDIAEVVSA